MLKAAPAAILVCGDQNILKFKDLWIQDCSAASENMLLAAHDLGLGAVWIGVYPADNLVKEVQSILNIPQHVTPFSIIGMGYPAEEKPSKLRYDISKIHNNTW
jgi:nitroreductase